MFRSGYLDLRLWVQARLLFGLQFWYVLAASRLVMIVWCFMIVRHTWYYTSFLQTSLLSSMIDRKDCLRFSVADHHLVAVVGHFQMFGLQLCFRRWCPVRWSSCSAFVIVADWRVHCLKNCSFDFDYSSLGLQQSVESFDHWVPYSCVERSCFRWCFHFLRLSFIHFLKHLCCGSFCYQIDFLIGQKADFSTIWIVGFTAAKLVLSLCFYNLHIAAFHYYFNMP